LFANPATEKPYHEEEIQKKHIWAAAKAAGIKSRVGWKTFRHSYRSWLDQTDAPIGVQVQMVLKAESKETAKENREPQLLWSKMVLDLRLKACNQLI
jgi:integrase